MSNTEKNVNKLRIIYIVIQNDFIKINKYLKIINNLKSKKFIHLEFVDKNKIISNNEKIIICDSNLNIENSYEDFILALKGILNQQYTCKIKMKILKDICKNIPILLFSCGPSSNINFSEIKKIQNDYIIISVKYIYNHLIKNGIKIDFGLKSQWHSNYQSEYKLENCISIYLCSFNNLNKTYDLNFCPIPSNHCPHIKTFKNLVDTKNLDIIRITDNKIFDTHIKFYLAHIMLEVAIPLSIFIGSKNIFTFGWDGPKNEISNYFNKNVNIDYSTALSSKNIICKEFKYIKFINNIFINNGINVYKGNKISPIDLRYKNVY